MSRMRTFLAWLKLRERQVSLGIAGLGLLAASLSAAVALFQAILLANERATPYQTARYVRQLEVTEKIAGAVEEQWLTIINAHIECRRQVATHMLNAETFAAFKKEFEESSQDLHVAYAAARAVLPGELTPKLDEIWAINERFYDGLFTVSGNCNVFEHNYGVIGGVERFNRMRSLEHEIIAEMRRRTGIDELPPPRPIEDALAAREQAEKPPEAEATQVSDEGRN